MGCVPGHKTPLQGDSEGFNSLTVHQIWVVGVSWKHGGSFGVACNRSIRLQPTKYRIGA